MLLSRVNLCFVQVNYITPVIFFLFNDTATTEIYTLSLHDALPIYDADLGVGDARVQRRGRVLHDVPGVGRVVAQRHRPYALSGGGRQRALHDEGELHRTGTALVVQPLAHVCSPPSLCSGAAAPGRRPLRRLAACDWWNG